MLFSALLSFADHYWTIEDSALARPHEEPFACARTTLTLYYLTNSGYKNVLKSVNSHTETLKKEDFVSVVGKQMTRSPSLDKENANKILGKRRYDHDGSIWDDKPMGKNGTPNQALRIKISGAINDSGYS